jgi:hypothetical protein
VVQTLDNIDFEAGSAVGNTLVGLTLEKARSTLADIARRYGAVGAARVY